MGMPAPQLRHAALADEITTLYAHINAATYRLLELIARFDEQGLFAAYDAVSTAHWLNWACGIGLAAGREKVRVARALQELPVISAAFRSGELSYSKVRAVTRVATPACEETLLEMARHATAAQTERIVRNYRIAMNLDSGGRQVAPERGISCYWDEYGCLSIRGRLAPEQGALFLKALERTVEELTSQEDSRPVHEQVEDYPMAARRADALVVLSERELQGAERGGSTADRFQVTVSVSAETLAAVEHPVGGTATRDASAMNGSESSEASDTMLPADLPAIDGGPPIGPERARRLCCDGSVIPILESAAGEILSVGRKTRTVPPALRRALQRRDGGCRFPGCDQRHWVDAHHILHRAHGGESKLDNLVLLCRRHHTAVHEEGYSIRKLRTDTGIDFQFVHPRGWIVPNSAEDLTAGSWRTLIDDVSAETPGLHATTMLPHCDFRPPDYDHIAWWMVNFMRR